MSRIGKSPIEIPAGVNIEISPDTVKVVGPKGQLQQGRLPGILIEQKDSQLLVSRKSDDRRTRSFHGLMRSLLQNMVDGVAKGFEKKLEVNGVGFKVNLSGSDLRMRLGYSHEVVYSFPAGIDGKVEQNIITVSGIDKQQVGQVASEIRALRKPEPYKGKGIKYQGERIIRKSGKSGKEG